MPPAGTHHRHRPGARRSIRRRTTAYRAINRAWKSGATVQFADGRYVVIGLVGRAADGSGEVAGARRRARRAPPAPAGEEAAHRPVPALERQHGRGLDALGARAVRLRVRHAAAGRLQDAADRQGRRRDPRRRCAAAARRARRGGRGGGGRGGGAGASRNTPIACRRRTSRRSSSSSAAAARVDLPELRAATFAIQQFKLPVRNVVAGLRPEEFFLHGTIVEVTRGSVAAGDGRACRRRRRYSPTAARCSRRRRASRARCSRSIQDTGSPLLSGYLIGEKYLNGKAAALDVQLDAGHVDPARLPAGVARPAVRHVQGAVQRGAQLDDRALTRLRSRGEVDEAAARVGCRSAGHGRGRRRRALRRRARAALRRASARAGPTCPSVRRR